MSLIAENIRHYRNELPSNVKLVAVSKFKPVEDLMEAYNAGQRVFGENRPVEFADKVKALPSDIEWHFIGHLQTNKLKFVVPYASLIQSIDSEHLLAAVDRYAGSIGKKVNILLEIHIAQEEAKQGFNDDEVLDLAARISDFKNVELRGIMAMASFVDDMDQVRREFQHAASVAARVAEIASIKNPELSIGMTGDYRIALECGATMVRIGTAIFGARQ
ncbi:MAG: YggS family pyridoxal phosphate-dependent enzyme [Bacteroidales bacterium]|nr:YggS family pyridoxal phosphate-dependent enzyme [Bacteroidales bacterium]